MKCEAMWMRVGVAMVMVWGGVAGRAAAQSEASLHKTTYYLHGRIYTNDPKEPWAAAMAVPPCGSVFTFNVCTDC